MTDKITEQQIRKAMDESIENNVRKKKRIIRSRKKMQDSYRKWFWKDLGIEEVEG